MHGIVRPSYDGASHRNVTIGRALINILYRLRFFGGIVVLPTLLVAIYFFLIASNQYESTASFVVRKADSAAGAPPGLGQIFGLSLGLSQTQSEAYVIRDYLLSNDAVSRLRAEDRLVARFRRDDTDWLSRLWSSDPTPEALLKYYRRQVGVSEEADTGISHISVIAFTPEDAYELNQKLLRMGEERINALNVRTFNDQVSQSRKDLELAEQSLTDIQSKMTLLREVRRDVDPQGTSRAQIGLVSNLTGSLVEARSRLAAMGRLISPSSPQYRALAAQVAALEAQVAGQKSLLAGQGDDTIANNLGDYEALTVRREFAAQRFTAAAAAYEQAKAEARRKQLYLIRVVDPNRPVKSLYPQRTRIVLTVLAGIFLTYAIGRMLLAGLREHSL